MSQVLLSQGGFTPMTQNQNLNYTARANAMSILENSFQPFRMKPSPKESLIGVSTHQRIRGGKLSDEQKLYKHQYDNPIKDIRGGRIGIDAPHKKMHHLHPALRSAPHTEGFLQQIPLIFKDHQRMGAGFTLM
jgi:hypothetical protein